MYSFLKKTILISSFFILLFSFFFLGANIYAQENFNINSFTVHAPQGQPVTPHYLRTRLTTTPIPQQDIEDGLVYALVYEVRNINENFSYIETPRLFFESGNIPQPELREHFENLSPQTTYQITARFYKFTGPEDFNSLIQPSFWAENAQLIAEESLEVTTAPTVEDQLNCYIQSLDYNISGKQEDDWWNRNNPPVLTLTFTGTQGCQTNPFQFQMYQRNRRQDASFVNRVWSGVTDVVTLNNPLAAEKVFVDFDNPQIPSGPLSLVTSEDNTVSISMTVGDNECKALRYIDVLTSAGGLTGSTNIYHVLFGAVGLVYECEYTFEINDDRSNSFLSYWNPRNLFSPSPTGNQWNLRYNACDAPTSALISATTPVNDAIFIPCDVPWSIRSLQPYQDGQGNIAEISPFSLIQVSPACLDDNNEPIPDCYALLEPLPGITRIDGETTIGEYLNTLIRIAIGLLGLFAVIMIVVGGLQYMSTDAISGKSEGRDRITKALLGLLLALGSFTILNTINPDLTVIDPNASVDLLDITVDREGNIRANQFIEAESEDNVGATFQMGTLSPEVEAVAERIENGITISNINVRGDEGSTHGEAQIIFNDGSVSDWFNIRFGYAGLSSSWTSGQGMSPTGQFTLGSNRNDFTLGNNQAIMSLGSPRSNLGAAFISIDQANYVGIGIHGHHSGGLNNTAGCIRMTNADLMIIFDGIVPGESTITITAN